MAFLLSRKKCEDRESSSGFERKEEGPGCSYIHPTIRQAESRVEQKIDNYLDKCLDSKVKRVNPRIRRKHREPLCGFESDEGPEEKERSTNSVAEG